MTPEQTATGEQVSEIDENSSIDEILASHAEGEDPPAESPSEEVSPEENAGEATGGEPEQTPDAEEGDLKKGTPVPFERFSKVIQERNELREQGKEFEQLKQQIDAIYGNPNTLRAVLKAQGYSDAQVDKHFRDNNIDDVKAEPKTSTQETLASLTKDLDLETKEGWLEANYRIAQKVADERAEAKLEEYDRKSMSKREAEKFIVDQEAEAKQLADEVFKIPYGESGKSEKDTKTAVGKIAAYLQRYPQDAYLGHVKLLRLAMSEEALKLGAQQAQEEEAKRQKDLKASAVESAEVPHGGEETPDENWSVQRIMEWRKKHST